MYTLLYIFVFQSWRVIRYINVLLIMAEHPPLLDTSQILTSDISLLSAPIVSADGTQQVRKPMFILMSSTHVFLSKECIMLNGIKLHISGFLLIHVLFFNVFFPLPFIPLILPFSLLPTVSTLLSMSMSPLSFFAGSLYPLNSLHQ